MVRVEPFFPRTSDLGMPGRIDPGLDQERVSTVLDRGFLFISFFFVYPPFFYLLILEWSAGVRWRNGVSIDVCVWAVGVTVERTHYTQRNSNQ